MTSKVIVKKIDNKGKGLFALRSFRKNELILKGKKGKRITKSMLRFLPEDKKNHTTEIASGVYEVMPYPEKYINHSCNPNAYIKRRNYFALKPIKEGGEITIDYRVGCRDRWVLKCNCRSTNCKGIVVGDFFTLSKKEQKKYSSFLPEWFKKEFSNKLKNLEK